MVDTRRGRPPLYADLIYSIQEGDGWVNIAPQANRTAPSGYRGRYPGFDFKCVRLESGDKPFMLQARRVE